MRSRGQTVAAVAWGVAGIPLLATFVQTILALLGTTSQAAGLSAIVSPLLSVAVFREAAIVFKASPTLVLGLFLLIAAAWGADGVATFVLRNRDAAFAAAGLVSVLYLILFFGVYFPLFSREIPAVQLLGFFSIPVVATVLVVVSALSYEWEANLVEDATVDLADVETMLDDAREEFDTAFEERFGDLSALESVAPTGVAQARESREDFYDRCETLRQELDDVRAIEDPERLRREATDLRERVSDLDPVAAVDRIDENLRRKVSSGIRSEFGSVTVQSRYGEQYTLVNLPTRLREADVSSLDGTVHVDRFDDALLSRVEEGDLVSVAHAIEDLSSHIDEIEAFVDEREDQVADAIADAESTLSTVEDAVAGFDEPIASRVEDYLIDGRHEALPGASDVRTTIQESKRRLHDCQFDEAIGRAQEATEQASRLLTVSEFLKSLVGSIEHRGQRVSVPDAVPPALLRDLEPAFEQAHGVTFDVRDSTLSLTYADADAEPESESDEPDDETGLEETPNGSQDQSARPEKSREEVLDAVLYVYRELGAAARESETAALEFQLERLPDSVAEPSVLRHAASFLERQNDLIAAVDLQSDSPPGFLEVRPKDGVDLRQAFTEVRSRYEDRYA